MALVLRNDGGTAKAFAYSAFPMRKRVVPQTGQVPLVAGLPFFIVTCCGSFISRLVLHFRQYASIPCAFLSCPAVRLSPCRGA